MLHRVVTTEKVAVTYRVAGMGSRFLAWLADAGLIALLGVMGLFATLPLQDGREGLGSAVFILWVFCLKWGYFLLFEWLWIGQTPGKRLLGIRVIRNEGTSISFLQSAARNLVRVVDSLPALYAVGFVAAACDRRHRRLGDLAAGTLVVHLERKARAVQPLPDALAHLDADQRAQVRRRLGALDRPQKQTLLDLCLRRDQLPLRERAALFAAAATFVKARLDVPEDAFQSDEKFVLAVTAVLGERPGAEKRS